MNKEASPALTAFVGLLAGILFIAWGAIKLKSPHPPSQDMLSYLLVVVGLVIILCVPIMIRASKERDKKQAEMQEMLEDYRQRKKQNRP